MSFQDADMEELDDDENEAGGGDDDDFLGGQERQLMMEVESYVKGVGKSSFCVDGDDRCTLDLDGLDGMVMQFLVRHGYAEAAEAFQSEAMLGDGCTLEGPCDSSSSMSPAGMYEVKRRASVIRAILQGDIPRAYSEIEGLDPTLFVDRSASRVYTLLLIVSIYIQ